jgi:hypothetical protein
MRAGLPATWRKIAEMKFYRSKHCKVGWGSYMITLDCGHKTGLKQSVCKNKTIGSRMHCWECALNGRGQH